jgi:hypothetical protein
MYERVMAVFNRNVEKEKIPVTPVSPVISGF